MKIYVGKLLLLFIFITGCDSEVIWKDPPYEITWIDNNVELSYNIGKNSYIGRVKSEVVAVGSNNKYITVEQCEKNLCNFYYINREIDHKYADSSLAVKGPFSKEEFKKESMNKGLPKLYKIN